MQNFSVGLGLQFKESESYLIAVGVLIKDSDLIAANSSYKFTILHSANKGAIIDVSRYLVPYPNSQESWRFRTEISDRFIFSE